MANYSSLKSAVTSVIKTNGNKEITGAVLQSTLLAIINSLGDGFLFKGVATPSTNPGTPDQNVFYIGGAGTYTNFNNLEVPTGYLGVLKYNGVWAVSTVQVGAVPVNDLTTGGTTVPLSAEMGKTLKTYHDNNATAIQTVDGKVSQLEAKVDDLSTGKYYGYFAQEEDLPEADVDGFAYVGEGPTYTIYNCVGGVWTSSDITVNQSPIGNDEDIDQNEDGKLQFANRVYNAQQPNGMGYKILRKDATFSSQVTDENTIYEIRYPFALSADFTMPANCVLKFDGGSISGAYTLSFSNTTIEGDADITCDLDGVISGTVNAAWFGLKPDDSSFDNGTILNKVAQSFKRIFIPRGSYYFSTPISMTGMLSVESFGSLYYVGTNLDCAAFCLVDSLGTFRFCGTLSGYDNRGRLNFIGDGGTNVRGYEFENCNNSIIIIQEVYYFNEGVRLYGNAAGCSYNSFFLGRIRNTNRALRIYQDNGGWANQNIFYGGRIYNESTFYVDTANKYAVYIKGPGTSSDTYDSVNALTFIGISMEGFNQTCAVYAYRTLYCKFDRIRAEGVSTLVKFDGECAYNYANWSYSGQKLFDATSVLSFPLKYDYSQRFLVKRINLLDFKRCYENGAESTRWLAPKGVSLIGSRSVSLYLSNYSWTLTESSGLRTTGQALPCVVLDVTTCKTFFVRADADVRFVVYQIEKTNGTAIDLGPDQENYLAPIGQTRGSFSYYSSVYGWMNPSIRKSMPICIRDASIKKIAIAVHGTLANFEVYSYDAPINDEELAPVKTEGTTAERPTYAPLGAMYFDTDLGKMLLWNGTAWVNMDGTALS